MVVLPRRGGVSGAEEVCFRGSSGVEPGARLLAVAHVQDGGGHCGVHAGVADSLAVRVRELASLAVPSERWDELAALGRPVVCAVVLGLGVAADVLAVVAVVAVVQHEVGVDVSQLVRHMGDVEADLREQLVLLHASADGVLQVDPGVLLHLVADDDRSPGAEPFEGEDVADGDEEVGVHARVLVDELDLDVDRAVAVPGEPMDQEAEAGGRREREAPAHRDVVEGAHDDVPGLHVKRGLGVDALGGEDPLEDLAPLLGEPR
mmetsp:Transcript_14994/g.42486  ORF Transcript_14994/g.42486 Transcript_14994/m.42486 type:complete len:262 (+) Transcript_14994:71-856(+)